MLFDRAWYVLAIQHRIVGSYVCKMPFYYLVNKTPYHSNTGRRKSIIPTYLYVLKTSSHGEFFIEYHRITIDSGLPRAFEVACRP